MNILVTGGLGFIGSFLAEAWLQRGDNVTVVDDCSANVIDAADLLLRDPPDHVHAQDVRQYLAGRRDLRGFDCVFHCAAPVGAAGILGQRRSMVQEIVAVTDELCRACWAARVPLVNISTSEVYGFTGRYQESDELVIQPPRPSARLGYALGKLAGEHVVQQYVADGMWGINVRPFNVAGPRQARAKGFVLPTFVEQALAGEPLTVYGSGQQRRTFLAVTDLCWFLTEYAPVAPPGATFNVGNPANECSVKDLALAVWDRCRPAIDPPLAPRIEHTTGQQVYGTEYEEAVGFHKLPRIDRALELGWEPHQDLDALIEMTKAHYLQPHAQAHHPV